MKEVSYRISSRTAILFHNVNSMDLVKPNRMKDNDWERSPEVFRSRLYLEGDKLALPDRVVMGMVKKSAQNCGIKKGRKTLKDSISSIVTINGVSYFEQEVSDVGVHSEYVLIKATKGRVLRLFPILKKWSVIINFAYDDNYIDENTLTEIMEFGGLFMGFGDFRAEKGGTYGRFTVEKL